MILNKLKLAVISLAVISGLCSSIANGDSVLDPPHQEPSIDHVAQPIPEVS